jgi:hypothetical protein
VLKTASNTVKERARMRDDSHHLEVWAMNERNDLDDHGREQKSLIEVR